MRPHRKDETKSVGADLILKTKQSPLEATAAILTQAGPLGDLRRRFGTWAPRQQVAATLDIHPDTLARAEKAGQLLTRIAVGSDRRCRVEVLLDDVALAFGDRA